jgi:hypothetical protein
MKDRPKRRQQPPIGSNGAIESRRNLSILRLGFKDNDPVTHG